MVSEASSAKYCKKYPLMVIKHNNMSGVKLIGLQVNLMRHINKGTAYYKNKSDHSLTIYNKNDYALAICKDSCLFGTKLYLERLKIDQVSSLYAGVEDNVEKLLHDIKTSLFAIHGSIELLLRELLLVENEKLDKSLTSNLENWQSSLDRLGNKLQNSNDKLIKDRNDLRSEKFNIDEVMKQYADMLELVKNTGKDIEEWIRLGGKIIDTLSSDNDSLDPSIKTLLGILPRQFRMISDGVKELYVVQEKVKSGKSILRRKYFNLIDEIKDKVEFHASNAKQRNVKISTAEVTDDIPNIYADRNMVLRILDNLISNAIKYNKEGGEVFVSVRKKDGFIEVSISDTGIGISPEDLSKIFERGLRGGNVQGIEGTGIGLWSVKEAVEALGGTIWVESEMGKGSKFTFTLPIERKSV